MRLSEQAAEREVSRIIGAMPVLWLAVDDPPGSESLRGYIERNSIALLSNLGKPPLDSPSASCVDGGATAARPASAIPASGTRTTSMRITMPGFWTCSKNS